MGTAVGTIMGWLLLLLLLLQQTQSGNCGGSCTAAARNCQRVAWPQSFERIYLSPPSLLPFSAFLLLERRHSAAATGADIRMMRSWGAQSSKGAGTGEALHRCQFILHM